MAGQQRKSANLLSPAESAPGQHRRKSTLSGNGFFIDYRRRSSALRQQQQPYLQLEQLAPVGSQPSSPSRAHSRLSRASYSGASVASAAAGSSPVLAAAHLSPLQAPMALAGSRKTSIFDPAGHSLMRPHQPRLSVNHQAAGSSQASNSQDQRRRSTMTTAVGGGPSHALLVAAAARAAAQRGKCAPAAVVNQLVPVIGCSPTSIEASLKALDESKRYEKLLRGLQRRRERKERRRLMLEEGGRDFSSSCGQRRKSLRMLLAGAGGGGKRPRQEQETSQFSLDAGELSASDDLGGGGSADEPSDDSDGLSISDNMSFASSRSSLPSVERVAQSMLETTTKTPSSSGIKSRSASQTPRRSLVGSALRRLASSVVTGGGSHHTKRSVSVGAGLDYWYYYNYLRENSLDQAKLDEFVATQDELVAGEVAGEPAQADRRQRQLVNHSLARLEIMNSARQEPPNAAEVAQRLAGQLALNASEQSAAHLLDDLFRDTTDNELNLSTSSSATSSPNSFKCSASRRTSCPSSASSASSLHLLDDADFDPEESSKSSSRGPASSLSPSLRAYSPGAGSSLNSLNSSRPSTAAGLGVQTRLPAHLAPNLPRLTGWRSSASFAPSDADADEPMDDFDRLNRCHRNYKPPPPPPPPMKPTRPYSVRDPTLRLSVRSSRSGFSLRKRRNNWKDPRDCSSMSWDTLDRLNAPDQPEQEPDSAGAKTTAKRTTSSGLAGWFASWSRPLRSSRNRRNQLELDEMKPVTTSYSKRTQSQTSIGSRPRTGTLRENNRAGSLRVPRGVRAKQREGVSCQSRAEVASGAPNAPAKVEPEPDPARDGSGDNESQVRARAFSAGTKPASVAPALGHLGSSLSTNREAGKCQASWTSLAAGSTQPPHQARRSSSSSNNNNNNNKEHDERKHFTCLVVGARQAGKRTIVKCFVKLLNEFRLAATEYRKERLLAKLAGCQEHLREILERHTDEEPPTSGTRRHLNSWLSTRTPNLNRFLSGQHHQTGAKQRVNSVCVTQAQPVAACHDQQRRHTAIEQTSGSNLLTTGDDKPKMISPPGVDAADDNRFLRVHHHQQQQQQQHLLGTNLTNKSDSNINYHTTRMSSPDDAEDSQLQLQVPAHWHQHQHQIDSEDEARRKPMSNSTGSIYDEPLENTRSQHGLTTAPMRPAPMSRRQLKALVSLRELNKRRIRIKFKTRRRLNDQLLVPVAAPTSKTQPPVQKPDAFLVVYSINDRDSFEYAKSLVGQVRALKEQEGAHMGTVVRPVVLVANKIDLERAKVVKSEEGRAVARKNGCKFIEISCTVGFNLDNLLVGLRTQLVLKHHLALNSLLKSNLHAGKPTLNKGAGTEAASQISRSQKRSGGLLSRLYRRYVTDDNDSQNYDCDNFSKL